MNPTNRLRICFSGALLASVWLSGCGSDDPSTGPTGPVDTAPPLTPLGLEGRTMGQNGFAARWEPNAEPDLAGYRAYVKAPGAQAFLLISDAPVTQNRISWSQPDGSPGEYLVRVSAVDLAGNESQLSDPLSIRPSETPAELVNHDSSGDSQGGRGPSTTPEPPDGGHPNPQENDH